MKILLREAKSEFRAIGRELWADGRGWILLAVSSGWALSMGVRFVYPALIPFIRSEFQIDLAITGLLLTMLWGSYAIGHIPGGVLGDRIGEGNILVLSSTVSTGALILVFASINIWMLFAGTVAFGLATALYGPTRFTILTDIYSRNAGSAIGLTMAAGNLGNAVFPVLAAIVAAYLSWRFGFGMFVPLFMLLMIALWVAIPGRTSGQTSAVDTLSLQTLKRIVSGITRDSIPIIVAIQTTVSFIFQGFSSFYPIYLTISKDISPETAAMLFGMFFAIGAVIQPIAGNMMDRFGTWKTLFVYLGGCVLALWLLPFMDTLAPLVVVTVLFSAWNGCGVITQTYIADTLPTEMQGTGLGTLKAGWMTIGATAPLIIGIFAEHDFFDAGFLLLAVIGSMGLALALRQAF